MAINYTAVTPSPNVSLTNPDAPSGFDLISCSVQEDPPREDIPTLTGILRAVGLPRVRYQLTYFTMDAVPAATLLTEDTSGVSGFIYCGKTLDNVYLVGGALRVAPTGGDRGIKGVTYAQVFAALGQRVAYA